MFFNDGGKHGKIFVKSKLRMCEEDRQSVEVNKIDEECYHSG